MWVVAGDRYSMTLPIMTLALITVANFSRYMRSSSIDVLAQDYIKVARAKGLPERWCCCGTCSATPACP